MPTTRIVTINEIIGHFNTFKDGHPQLNDMGYGPTSEIGVSRQMEFPYLWITHQSDSFIKISTNKTQIPELKFVMLFMDQVNDEVNTDNVNGEDSNNGQEVLSDMFQVMQDCVGNIISNWGQYGIMITEDVRTFPAFDETTDRVNGWAAEITFTLSHINCTQPT